MPEAWADALMGLSASGNLFFGVTCGDADPRWSDDPPDDQPEWDEWLALLAGLSDPYQDPIVATMPSRSSADDPRYQQWKEAQSDWVARRDVYWQAKARLAEECPVMLITTGDLSYGWYDYHLALNGTYFSNYQTAERIPEDHFQLVTPERIIVAQQWCAAHNLAFEDPAWHLASTFG